MKYTYALLPRIPNSLKPEEKKLKLNVELMQKQAEGIVVTLKEAGVNVAELPIEDGACTSSLTFADYAFVLNKTALICRPNGNNNKKENGKGRIADILSKLGYQIIECPEKENGKKVLLNGSDILHSGKEIFVGLRKNCTNLQGAAVLARNFPDYSVVPLPMEKYPNPLSFYVSIIDPSIIAIGSSKEAYNILARLEEESSLRYKKLTVDEENDGVACFKVNDRLVFRKDKGNDKYTQLKGLQLWAVDVSEIAKGNLERTQRRNMKKARHNKCNIKISLIRWDVGCSETKP
ncbi:hypothetical protein WR25_23055 [Diploscapter pachys]|uniref:Uncharacterized protein n=1 Tax=Diploscapter pachys TaxID=2018661 RepID=A0A2A2JD19_9BILA|nr:hypothetical protein WR25_23055 [Diploscapter pachys]